MISSLIHFIIVLFLSPPFVFFSTTKRTMTFLIKLILFLTLLNYSFTFNIERIIINNATIFDTNKLADETATEKNEIVEYVAKIVKTFNTILSVALVFGITVFIGILVFCIIAPIILSCTACLTACFWCLRSDSINRSIVDIGRKLERLEAIQKLGKTESNVISTAAFDTHSIKRD